MEVEGNRHAAERTIRSETNKLSVAIKDNQYDLLTLLQTPTCKKLRDVKI